MTTTDKLRRHYDTLTPTERIALIVEAFGKGDETELESLGRTCPQYHYKAKDMDVVRGLEAMFDVVHVTVIEIQDYIITYLLITNALDKDGGLPWEKAIEGRNIAASLILTTWNAFRTVCKDHGLEPEKVLEAAKCPLPDAFEIILKLHPHMEPNEKIGTQLLEAFRSVWKVAA